MISRSTAGVLCSPRSWSITPILVLASSAGAADTPGPIIPAALIYRLLIASFLVLVGIVLLIRTRFWRLEPRNELDAIGPIAPVIWFCAAVSLYLLVYVLSPILSGLLLGGGSLPPGTFRGLAASQAVFTMVAFGLSLAVISIMRRLDHSPLSGLPAPPAGLAWGVLVFVGAVPLLIVAGDGAVLVHFLVTGLRPPAIAHETLQVLIEHRADPRVASIIAGAVIGAPILEETVYRGLLQKALVGAFGSRRVGIVLTAALFALSHRMGDWPVPWHALASIVLVGLICGFLREHPKAGLTGAIAFHAAFNFSNIILAMYLVGDVVPD